MRIVMMTRLFLLGCLATASLSVSAEEEAPTMTVFGDLIELGEQIEIETADKQTLQFDPKPILNWSNPTRNAGQKGCVFVWHRHGRPGVIGSIFTHGNATQIKMRHEMHSLTEQPLHAHYQEKMAWSSTESGIQWIELNKAPTPRTNARLRLVQMRAIARQFSATLEEPNGTQSALELKPTPLYRYSSSKYGVLDGAIFSLALGTDPEVMLLVEATKEGDSPATWQVAFARFHYWKVFVENESGEIVWKADRATELIVSKIGDANTIGRTYVSYQVDQRKLEP